MNARKRYINALERYQAWVIRNKLTQIQIEELEAIIDDLTTESFNIGLEARKP